MPSTSWTLTVWSRTGVQLNNISCRIAIDPARVYGAKSAFGATLRIPYELDWYPAELSSRGPCMLSLEGWLAAATDASDAKGILIPSQVSVPYNALAVPLTPEDIEAIEEQRRGDAAVLKITLSGLAIIPNANVQAIHQVRDGYGGDFQETALERLDIHRVTTQGDNSLRIEREQWLTILSQLGAGQRRLVEVPAPVLANEQNRWDECSRRLTEATQHYRRGEYEQAIAFCRSVVEGVATVVADTWSVPRQKGDNFEAWTKAVKGRLEHAWDRDKEAPAMLSSLLFSAWTWTSPSLHYGSDIPLREETSFALSLCTDLLMFASQLLTAHPRQPVPPESGSLEPGG